MYRIGIGIEKIQTVYSPTQILSQFRLVPIILPLSLVNLFLFYKSISTSDIEMRVNIVAKDDC